METHVRYSALLDPFLPAPRLDRMSCGQQEFNGELTLASPKTAQRSPVQNDSSSYTQRLQKGFRENFLWDDGSGTRYIQQPQCVAKANSSECCGWTLTNPWWKKYTWLFHESCNTSAQLESSMKMSVCHTINATLSMGCICFPFAFWSSGILFGIVFSILFAYISFLSTRFFVLFRTFSEYKSFEDAASCTGHFFVCFIILTVLLFNFGTLVGCLVCVRNILDMLINSLKLEGTVSSNYGYLINRENSLMVITCLYIIPSCIIISTTRVPILAFLGPLGIEVLVVMTFIILCRSSIHGLSSDNVLAGKSRGLFPNSFTNVLQALPLFSFAFVCQPSIPRIYCTLRDPTSKRMETVADRSLVFVCCTYILMGISGFLLFGTDIKSNILENYEELFRHQRCHLAILTLLFLLVTQLMAYPFYLEPCVESLVSLLGTRADSLSIARPTLTLSFILLSLLSSLHLPSIEALFGTMGSILGASIGMIFPGIFYFEIDCLQDLESSAVNQRKWKGIALIVLGLIVACVGTWAAQRQQ